MTRSQENTASSLPRSNQMACRRGTQNPVLADEELLDTIGSADLRNLLDHLRIEVATIACDDEGCALGALGD